MFRVLLTLLALALPTSAPAQFKGYFDVGALRIAELKEPDWAVRVEENRVRYMCVGCASPTAIESKGLLRAERLPEAFESGSLTPAFLKQQGDANAQRLGTRFLVIEPLTVGSFHGVQMEASAELGGAVFFVTRWIGQGDRVLDVKVTTRDLAFGRALAGTAMQALVPQVFGGRYITCP